jgi:hypothetical protein
MESTIRDVREFDAPATKLPEWCDVYAGLTDEEIAEIEKIALSRAEMTRASD